jgi:hypothetical protein
MQKSRKHNEFCIYFGGKVLEKSLDTGNGCGYNDKVCVNSTEFVYPKTETVISTKYKNRR